MTITYRATWMTSPDTPLTGPAGANIPEIVIVRDDTGVVVSAANQDMVEQVNIPGSFVFEFTPPDDTLTYSARADGDPAVIGQVQAGTRFQYGIGDAVAALADTRIDATITSRATQTSVDAIATTGGAGPWTTATGFAVAGDAMALTPAERTTLAGVIDAALVAAHGAGSWVTATGFAVVGDAMALTPAERTTLLGVFDAAHGVGSWVGAGLTAGQAAELTYIHIHTGAVNGNKMNHTRAIIGIPGRAFSDDSVVDQVVTQVDADTATFEQVP